jgi:hypothetical protein
MRRLAPLIVVLLLLLAPIARAAEVWHFKRDFLPALVKAVPGILKSQDKQTGRFGTGIWIVQDQHPMYPLAVAWATRIDGVENPYYHSTEILDAIMSAGDALIADQDKKGMWEFRKKDGSTWGQIYMPWTYSRWIRTFDLVKDGMPADRRAKWEKALLLGFDGIYQTEPKKPMQNIPVHNCMGLYLASKIFNKPQWQKAAVDYLHACVREQHPDGPVPRRPDRHQPGHLADPRRARPARRTHPRDDTRRDPGDRGAGRADLAVRGFCRLRGLPGGLGADGRRRQRPVRRDRARQGPETAAGRCRL